MGNHVAGTMSRFEPPQASERSEVDVGEFPEEITFTDDWVWVLGDAAQ